MAYIDEEAEYSMYNEIFNISEWDRFCSMNKIQELQEGLLPAWLDFSYSIPEDSSYYSNGEDTIYRSYFHTVINISGAANKYFFNENTDRYLEGRMDILTRSDKMQPFLIFDTKF